MYIYIHMEKTLSYEEAYREIVELEKRRRNRKQL